MKYAFLVAFLALATLPEKSVAPYCQESYTVSVKYYKYGKWGWRWSKRTAYRTETRYRAICCRGWGGSGCNVPICGGGAITKSCWRTEGYYIHSKTYTNYVSGGTCSSPGICTNCNPGYYSSNDVANFNAFCRACKTIQKCNKPRCTRGDYTVCDRCHGEHQREFPGRNDYTGKPDITRCQEACSWTAGRRCYPGTCDNTTMLFSTCRCWDGFTSKDTDCATFKPGNQPEIHKQLFELNGNSEEKSHLFLDRSNGAEKLWTKHMDWMLASVTVAATYKANYSAVELARDYINSLKTAVGVDTIQFSLLWERGNVSAEWMTKKDCEFETDCNITLLDYPIDDITNWYNQFGSLVFQHGDSLTFEAVALNGGKVTYIDWDNGEREGTYYLNGVYFTRTMELGFDGEPPYHISSLLDDPANSTSSPLITPDFSTDRTFHVSWDGWIDDLSGIIRYEIDAYRLDYADSSLKVISSSPISKTVNVSSNMLTIDLHVEENGPYAVEITTYDRAENYKTARRLLIVDDNSTVDLQNEPSVVTQADNRGWINEQSDTLEIRWPGRFINKRHHANHWLAMVKGGELELDDTHEISARNTSAIHNINGTVRCVVGRTITLDGMTWNVDFMPVPQDYFDEERVVLDDEEVIDGKRVVFTVRAYDVMDSYVDDSVTVMMDTSPPVIDNLWLTNGDYLNLSVHSVLEINDLIFEWEVYDEHSGLDEIAWRIFDNFTNTELLHGHSHESPQGEDQDMVECNNKYSNHSRGSNCYCSPYNGCYHKHYQIKPHITNAETGGILANGTHGEHDSDYYIEVTAINHANLTTISYHKITIDTSPPHAGVVHDGLRGQPEIDYQQSLTLSAHWDDFFDKESSVWFYLYAFSTECLNAENFNIHNIDGNMIHKTYESSAEELATGPGTYFVTVVAYNHALDGSKPVCSDGVTVDSTVVDVTEVVIKQATIRQGILKNENDGKIYLLTKQRELKEIVNPTASQIAISTTLPQSVISIYPQSRYINGSKMTINGQTYRGAGLVQLTGNPTTVLTSDSHITISWNASETPSGIHDFEVGLATHGSDYPDIRDFTSTHHHQYTTIMYPNVWDGTLFDILIQTTTKSGIISVKTIGPIQINKDPPVFRGSITVTKESTSGNSVFLQAKWDEDTFVDDNDPNPLYFSIAIGSHENGHDVKPFGRLSVGGSCSYNQQQLCSAVDVSSLPWSMHGKQTYYIVVKAENTGGLYVLGNSDPYYHNVELASAGVVLDIDLIDQYTLKDIYDIDFQTDTSTLSVSWSGFHHPHEDVSFIVEVFDDLSTDAIYTQLVKDANTATFSSKELKPYITYYQSVTAVTEAGNITVKSDGVTIVIENDVLDWLTVYDGPVNNAETNADLDIDKSHHMEDKRFGWINDVEYQISTNKLEAHWEIPEDKQYFVKDIFWAIEIKAPVAEHWTGFKDYEHLKAANASEVSDLVLTAGRTYRVLLKCCAGKYCYKPAKSSGVTIIPNPPITGNISVLNNGANNFTVDIDAFLDTDIEDVREQLNVVDHYEWAVTDAHDSGRLVTKWERANITDIYQQKLQFHVYFDKSKEISFTRCWKLAVRGYTKAGLSSMITKEMKNCSDINSVRPNLVIDAIGEPLYSSGDGHEGQGIYLEENALWSLPDVDYTPYHNILSAVWPTLRHKDYTWAVLELNADDPLTFYKSATELSLSDPCSHPDAIKCGGKTEQGYGNALFKEGELQHGHRYMICLHAPPTSIEHEFWTQQLDEVRACSDGVTVDLTPPSAADIWIGNNKGQLFQTSTSELITNWNSFIDVEETRNASHSSGIAYYEVAIGTSAGGTDIVEFVNVGLTNHKTFHQLPLKHGVIYFATVKGYDFTSQVSQSISGPVKIDTTPPVNLGPRITIPARYITSTHYVSACWTGVFEDRESGISHYEWCIGTSQGYDDVMNYVATTEECSQTADSSTLVLYEGHSYFISVKAFNNAGLWRTATSFAFTVDESPPIAGSVFDDNPENTEIIGDVDYITSVSELSAHWTPFHDPHSTMTESFVSVGTCPKCDDVWNIFPVGLKQNVRLSNLHLAEGTRYYVTVTAYNAAGLYTIASSDGVIIDTTPPIHGHVIDGTQGNDIQYQASRKSIGCKWYGFYDPQSTISHFEWRLGTTRGGDEIVANRNVHKSLQGIISDYEILTGYLLPQNRTIYCTVRAYNKAGMFSEASSNGLTIDTTSPVFIQELTQYQIGSVTPGTSVLRSVLRVEWQIEDIESSIESQHLSISSHIGGDFNSSSTWVPGVARDHTFTNLDLHDGSLYDVKIICCNGAKLCTTSIIKDILIDSTAPTTGTFAVNTDHAAALNRQPDNWMIWTPVSLQLAWLGFEDLHSGIQEYYINIGSYFMGDDLNKEPGLPFSIGHDSDAPILEDGMVQTYKLFPKPISKLKSIYISITARNKVGLLSYVLHGQFKLEHGGWLSLVRRCDKHTCLGHCVCAPYGEFCNRNDTICTSELSDNYARLEVKDFINLRFPSDQDTVQFSPLDTMLAAQWTVIDADRIQPLWFEWSIGKKSYDAPTGVFNAAREKVWHEVGTANKWIETLPEGRELLSGVTYSYFIKAWYSPDHYIVYKSPGVIIRPMHPKSTNIRGRRLKEVARGYQQDLDYISAGLQYEADWTGKFINTDDSIAKYHLYLSTVPGGHDVYELSKDIQADVTTYNLTGLTLLEYTRYYTVVQAFTYAGLHTTVVSDGFMLDTSPPRPGVVHDGKVITQLQTTSTNKSTELFWHGFSDTESGIVGYEYCVSINIEYPSLCDVIPYHHVGVATRAKIDFPDEVKLGTKLVGTIRAYDATGHRSEEVTSPGIVIDTTPPVRVNVNECSDNLIMDAEFETVSPSNLSYDGSLQCLTDIGDNWILEDNTCASVVKTEINGDNILVLSGVMTQFISNVTFDNGQFVLTFYTSTVPHHDLLHSVNDGFVDINDDRHSFITYMKAGNFEFSWQKHTYRFNVDSSDLVIKLGTVGRQHVIAVKDITLERCDVNNIEPVSGDGHVKTHTVFLNDWSSIHAHWHFEDKESEIVDYQWAIGTVKGGTQLQGFVSVGRKNFVYHSSLNLVHDSMVYVTVVAVNSAGLRTVSYSDAIHIDMTPPVFQYVRDGREIGEDIDYQKGLLVGSHWSVSDPESGVVTCTWGLGEYTGDDSIVEFRTIDLNTEFIETELRNNPNVTIYATLKCTNAANLTSSGHSDGFRILDTRPSLHSVVLEVLGHSDTQYPIRGHYHGDPSKIKFRWTGFDINDGIDSILVSLEGNDVEVSELVTNSPEGYTYTSFDGLSLTDGSYTVSITALNEVRMYSQKLSETFTLLTQPPGLTGKSMNTQWKKALEKAICNWDGVFTSAHPLYYEVTVRLSNHGEGDLLQWQETTNTELDLIIDTTDIPSAGVNVVFSVRAIGPSGLFVTTSQSMFIS